MIYYYHMQEYAMGLVAEPHSDQMLIGFRVAEPVGGNSIIINSLIT